MGFSATVAFLHAGIDKGWHTGGALAVFHRGELVLDYPFGEARAGLPMKADTLLQWFSSGKPITSVAIAQLFERGSLDLDAPVARWIPEFAARGKESITPRQLLTHTAGLRLADKLPADLGWEEMIRRICETPIEPEWALGEKAGYSTQAAWFILGELVRRISGRSLDLYAREEILQPAGMHDSWLRMSPEQYRQYRDRLGLLHEKVDGQWRPMALQDAAGMSMMRPGSSARGPARELARFYQILIRGGETGASRIARPGTIELFTRRHRTGLYDHTFFHTLDFGLGFIIDSNRHGPETVPYGYGRHSSPETFGHSGAQSSCGFADPAHQLAVAWVMNGLPGERPHQERARGINTAIYEDLGLG